MELVKALQLRKKIGGYNGQPKRMGTYKGSPKRLGVYTGTGGSKSNIVGEIYPYYYFFYKYNVY